MLSFKKSKSCYRFSACLFLLLFFSFSVQAQTLSKGTIKGILVDEKKVPLSFATILLKNQTDPSFIKTTLSKDKGLFQFDLATLGEYRIEVKMLGYETLTRHNIKVNQENFTIDLGILQLIPTARMLKAVSVTAQKPFIEQRADKIVVNMDNAISAGTSIMEVMNKLPVVQVSPDDQISLNGRSVQIYIDGKLTPLSAEALSSLLKGMSSANIQRIELIAHPSSKYDAAGSGGIINIVRKRNRKEGLSGNVYGGIGQGRYGKQNGGLNLNYKTKSYNLFLNTDYSFTKYFVDSRLKSDFFDQAHLFTSESFSLINSVRRTRTFTPNYGVDFYLSKKTTLSLSALDGIQRFGKNADSYTNGFRMDGSKTDNDEFLNIVKTNTNNFSSSLHLLHQIDTVGKEYTVDLDYYRYSNNTDQNNVNSLYDSLGKLLNNSRTIFDQNRKFNVYSAKADYTQPLKGTGHLEAGWKSSYVVSNNSNEFYNIISETKVPDLARNDYFNYAENINSLYATFSKNHKKLSYQLGLRGENTLGKGEQVQTGQVFNKNYFQLFPSAFFDYKLNARSAINISFVKKIDRPTYENLNPLIRIINSTNYLQGNPNLKPVISYNTSATYSYKDALFATFNYSINLHDFTYYTSSYNTSGIITTKPDNNKYTQYFSLILAYNRQFKPWWFTSTNATLNQQSFESTLNGYTLNSAGILALNFDSYDSFTITKKFSFLLLFRYRGKSQERNIINDPYFTLTSGLRQAIFGTRGSLALNVTDIFHTYKNHYIQNSVLIQQAWENRYETTALRLNFTYSFGGKIKKTKSSTGADDEKRRTNVKEN